MATYQLPYAIHEELRKELSEERAFKIAELLEQSVGFMMESAKDIAIQKKLELKDELSKELASKADVALVRTELKAEINSVRTELKAEIALVKSELLLEIERVESRLDKKITIWSIVIIAVMIILNKDSLTFIAQLMGLVK